MKFLILGAGPAGLSFAYRLLQNGEDDFLILEKESSAGGLCRSEMVDGYPLDIGGGHFLDTRNQMVLDFLFELMPEYEWNLYERNSQIQIYNQYINSPIEANIWQLPIDMQVEYLKDIARAGCNTSSDKPEKFVDWIYWKLGNRIADDYMIPYNKKMFGDNLNDLGTYWLEKLPNVSFEETLLSCLTKKAYGTQPGHAKFFYPKEYGSGEVWLRMAKRLEDKIQYGISVSEVDLQKKSVNNFYTAENIIVTIPWKEINIVGGVEDYNKCIEQLKYSSVVVEYSGETINNCAHWVYYPDEKTEFHRILVRSSFCKGKGYWTETNAERYTEKLNSWHYFNKYAYPLNTVSKPTAISYILDNMKKNNIFGLGRWGEWEHYNSDVVVNKAISLADKFTKKKA